MMSEGPSKVVRNEFIGMISEAIGSAYPQANLDRDEIGLSVSAEGRLADLSSSIAFRLSKLVKRSPQEIAKEIVAKLKPGKYISKLAELSGYVNAQASETEYCMLVIGSVMEQKGTYGSSGMGKGAKVLVEYPSVNPTKPWHIGHLRNALLGDSVSNILSFCSYKVEREDYIDDLGMQVAEILWGYINISDKPTKKFDQWLGELYVETNKLAKEKDILAQFAELQKRMEAQENEDAKLAKEIADKAVHAQRQTGYSYRIYHDMMAWESDIVRARLVEKAMEMAKQKKAVEEPKEGKYANCIVMDLEKAKGLSREFQGLEEKVKVLIRSNGTATYAAKDLAFHLWKFGAIDAGFVYSEFEKQPNGKPVYTTSSKGSGMEFGGAQKVINIIGSEQKFEQEVVRVMLHLMGYEDASRNMVHLPYGEVSLGSGAISGRSGNWIEGARSYTADELLAQTREKVLSIVRESEKIENKAGLEGIADSIAIGAIKFEYLKMTPEKKFVFSWDHALNFESNSGPYCMYMYARSQRILEKAGYAGSPLRNEDYSKTGRADDFELVKMLAKAQEVVEKSCNEYNPNVVAEYLLDLSQAFSKFYQNMPVIKGGEARELRLALVYSTKQTIGNMLRLLGIEPVEAM